LAVTTREVLLAFGPSPRRGVLRDDGGPIVEATTLQVNLAGAGVEMTATEVRTTSEPAKSALLWVNVTATRGRPSCGDVRATGGVATSRDPRVTASESPVGAAER
jgi:hypothetical protein